MKAVLVIDMPTRCDVCCFIEATSYGDIVCKFKKRSVVDMGKNLKLCDCPLKPMPEKKQHKGEIDYDYGYIDGWNDCLEEIEGIEPKSVEVVGEAE